MKAPISISDQLAVVARLLGVMWLAFGAVACSLVPQHGTPVASSMPAAFSATGTAPLQERWWQSFDDAGLDQAIERSLQQNFSLRAAWDRLDQAAALARKAGADRFPQFDATIAAQRSELHDGNTTVSDQYSGSLGAAYEVDLWGRVRSSAQAAELDRQGSAAELQTAALTLSAQVATTWYQLAEQQAQVELLERQLDTNQKVLELVTLRFRHGRVNATDVLQQRQLVESGRGDLVVAAARSTVLSNQLAVLLGENPGTASLPEPAAAVLVQLPGLPRTGVPAARLQQRPDVRRDWLALRAADQRVATAIADRLPRLSLTASVGDDSGRAADLFDDWVSNLAANLLLPVIDGGRRRAEVERTRALAAQALNDYRQTLLEAFAEVEDALVQEQRQLELLASIDQQSRLSKQVLERLRDSYRNGAVDYLRVLDALLTDQALERSRLQAQRQWIEFRIALHRALAGGWSPQRELPTTAGNS